MKPEAHRLGLLFCYKYMQKSALNMLKSAIGCVIKCKDPFKVKFMCYF